MSLLLDALKRAEQEKQARPGPAPAGKPGLELAPMASAPPAARPAAATPAVANPSAAPASSLPPAAKGAAPARSSRKVLWIAGCAIAVAIFAGAGYVWYSIAALSPSSSARAPALRPVAPPSPSAQPAAAPMPPPSAPPPSASPPTAAAPVVAAPVPPATRTAAVETPKPRPAERKTAEAPAEEPSPAMLQPARAEDRPRIAPEVASGYAALQRGDLAAAKRDYTAALAADNASLDATLGLATVEARGGRMDAAVVLYRRALEIDPRNPTALAGLASLSDLTRPEMLEQQLTREIARHPESASLHFMLGNVYASQALWTQAQASYYEAHRLDSSNPDILHNLAVSLDRLGQPKLAASMYHRALEATRSQATQFDAAAVRKRLDEIERR